MTKTKFFSCIAMSVCLQVYLCNMGMPTSHGGQNRALDLLELELQMDESHHVSAEN